MARQRQTVFALGLPPAKKMNPWPTVSCAQRPWKTTAAIGPLHREQAKQDGKPCALFANPGNLAIVAAIRRASSRVSSLAAARRPGSCS